MFHLIVPIQLYRFGFQLTVWVKIQCKSGTICRANTHTDIEFIAEPGDWAFHCHMSHHTMNAMGHEIPNTLGVDQSGIEEEIQKILPGFIAMGEYGMAEHQEHADMGHHTGPENTLAMMTGKGPYGNIEMGGMFTTVKVRNNLKRGDYSDPGWYDAPKGTVALRVSSDPEFGSPPRRKDA